MSLKFCKALGQGGSRQLLKLPDSAPTHSNTSRPEMSDLLLNPTAILLEMEIRKQAWRGGPVIPATLESKVGGL